MIIPKMQSNSLVWNGASPQVAGRIAELPTRSGNLTLDRPVDRYLLLASTICFLAAVVHTVFELRTGVFRPMRFNFVAIGLGFILQTAFLSVRGHESGRCPITNL